MIRRLAFAALLLGTVACGDDGDNNTTENPAPDAGQTAVDAGPPPVPNKITNVGTACASTTSCTGGTPTCLTTLSTIAATVNYPQGYCTATCTANVECGTGGECPIGESLRQAAAMGMGMGGALGGNLGALIPSNCYKSCAQDTDCRVAEGYRCTTVVNALSAGAGGATGGAGGAIGGGGISGIVALIPGPIGINKVCLPPAPVSDGGVPDAGPAADGGVDSGLDGGLDSGVSDASIDAATTDASTDSGATDARAADARADAR